MKSTLIAILFLMSFTVVLSAQNVKETSKVDTTNIQTKDSNIGITKKIVNWYQANTNYYAIVGLMTLESSFIPFPSEVVIPPAAYVARQPNSRLNIYLVIFFGTLGSIFGALINYFLALWLGRSVIYKLADSRIGHLCLLSAEKVQKAEIYFNKKGKISTFIGRLLPGIRQLISIPAGLSKMNLSDFILYTGLGALIWNVILAAVGWIAQGQEGLIEKYNTELSIAALVIVFLLIIFVVYKQVRKKKKK